MMTGHEPSPASAGRRAADAIRSLAGCSGSTGPDALSSVSTRMRNRCISRFARRPDFPTDGCFHDGTVMETPIGCVFSG